MQSLLVIPRLMDQRFPPEQETEYVRTLRSQLIIPLGLFAVIDTVFYLMSMFLAPAMESTCVQSSDRFLFVVCMLLSCCMIVFLLALILNPRFCSFRFAEVLSLFYLCSYLVLSNVANEWYMPQLFCGQNPHDAFGNHAEGAEVYFIALFVLIAATSCLILPIRSHLAWLVPFTGLCSFCTVVSMTSSKLENKLPYLVSCLGIACAVFVHAGIRNESYLRERWLAQQQVKKQQQITEKQRSAFSQLLGRMSDCVLHLGPDFELEEPCPNFAAMLFNTNPDSLAGACFCDHLASDIDHNRFAAAMKHEVSEHISGILPLHLKDAQGREVQVHAHYTNYRDEEGLPHYILGILESVEKPYFAESTEELGTTNRRRQIMQVGTSSRSGIEESDNQDNDEPRVRSMDAHNDSNSGGAAETPSVRSESSIASFRVLPDRALTQNSVKIAALIDLMRHWNLQLPRVTCCTLHVYTQELKRMVKRLDNKKCQEFRVFCEWQCPSCGSTDVSMEAACFEPGADCCSRCVEVQALRTANGGRSHHTSPAELVSL